MYLSIWTIFLSIHPTIWLISISLCMYLSVYLSISLSIHLSFHLSMFFYLCIFLSIYLPIYLSIYVSFYLLVDLPIYLSIYLSICLSVYYFPIYLSDFLSIYVSIDLSIWLSIRLSMKLSTNLSIIYLPIYLSIFLSFCISFFLSIYSSIHPSINLFIRLSIYLSIFLTSFLSFYRNLLRGLQFLTRFTSTRFAPRRRAALPRVIFKKWSQNIVIWHLLLSNALCAQAARHFQPLTSAATCRFIEPPFFERCVSRLVYNFPCACIFVLHTRLTTLLAVLHNVGSLTSKFSRSSKYRQINARFQSNASFLIIIYTLKISWWLHTSRAIAEFSLTCGLTFVLPMPLAC